MALFVALVAAAMWVMPAIEEGPDHFSAVLPWQFRLTSPGVQVVIWAKVGLGFGAKARPPLEGTRETTGSVRTATAAG